MTQAQILIVEDESIVAIDIQHRLKSLGYAVSGVASSGEEALKKVEETRPDLVLMDILLEGAMDGVAAAEHIRARFNIPVVYLTAYADETTLQRAKVTEPYGYILKPFEERELHTTIVVALYKHEMERKLQESERWLGTTLKSIGDAVIATDATGYIKFMNAVAETLTGWEQIEAWGKELTEVFNIISEATRTPTENPATKAIREGVVVALSNHILVARDGTEKLIDDSAAPIRDDQGTITGVVLVFRDTTEQRELRAQLARSERLRALGTMAVGVAHNFNNVLTAVLGQSQLLQIRTADPRITPGLTAIEKAAHEGAQIVHRLLEFTETEWDTLLDLVDCNKVASDAIELTRPRWEQAYQATGHPIKVDTHPGTDVTVLDSAGELRQALVNLIFNSVEAMPQGGQVTITTRRQGNQVILEVQDTGVGMNRFTQQHAFDPFFSTKGSVGAGLGLTQCYNIIERHQGKIKLTSMPGKGASVTIALPYATDKSEVLLARPVDVKPRRLLIVEDDETVRAVLAAMLTNMGHRVVACEDRLAALATLERDAFDLVCIGLSAPGIAGWELIDLINRRWPRLPVVVIADWSEPVKLRSHQVSIDGFLQRPFGYEQLLRVLSSALEGPRSSC